MPRKPLTEEGRKLARYNTQKKYRETHRERINAIQRAYRERKKMQASASTEGRANEEHFSV